MNNILKNIIFLIPVLMAAVLSQGCGKIIALTSDVNKLITKGTATIQWSAPTFNDDDSGLTDLSGYIVRYGVSPGVYTTSLSVGNVTETTIQNLDYGKTYYFTVVAINSTGDESPLSNEMSKSIQ